MSEENKTEITGELELQIDGEVMGPFPLSYIRAWVERKEVPEYVPARRPGGEVFVALLTLAEWKEGSTHVDNSAPPLRNAQRYVMKTLRQKPEVGSINQKLLLGVLFVLFIAVGAFMGVKVFVMDRHALMFQEPFGRLLAADFDDAIVRFELLEKELWIIEVKLKAKVQTHKAVAELERGNTERATEILEEVDLLRWVREGDKERVELGRMYLNDADPAEVDAKAASMLGRREDKFFIDYIRAENARRQRDNKDVVKQSIDMFQTMLDQYPGVLFERKLADAYYSNRKYDESIRRYELLSKKLPEDDDLFWNLGVSYLEKDKPDQAMKNLIRAKELDPGRGIIVGGKYAKTVEQRLQEVRGK